MSPSGGGKCVSSFTCHGSRRFVVAQAEEDGMTHVAVLRPFLKRDFADKNRLHPLDRHVGLRFLLEGTLLLDEGFELGAHCRQAAGVKTAAGMADINQLAVVEDPEHE